MRRLTIADLDLDLVLHAQQLDAIEIDLGDVAGLESVAADVDDLVVIIEIGSRQLQHGLGLQSVHERRTQSEFKVAFQVFMLRCGDARALFCALRGAARACGRARAGN